MQTHSATINLGLMRRSEGLARAEEGSGEESARASAFAFGEIRAGAKKNYKYIIYQNGIFHNRLYYVNISMSKKYLAKYKKITAKLRSARLEAKLTQVEAGKKLRKPQAYLSKIERGERGVDAVELAEFAKIYNKSLDYFIK